MLLCELRNGSEIPGPFLFRIQPLQQAEKKKLLPIRIYFEY